MRRRVDEGKGEGACFQRNNRIQSQLDEQDGNIKDDIKVSGVVMTAALTETGKSGIRTIFRAETESLDSDRLRRGEMNI